MFFFVLSGVVLGLPPSPQPPSFARAIRFIAARALRVYPSWWLVLGLTLLAWPFLFDGSRMWLWASLCPLPLPMERLIGKLIIPQAWTLHWEMLFYLALAVLLGAGRLLSGVACWGALILLGSLSPRLPVNSEAGQFVFSLVTHPICLPFIAGLLVARIVQTYTPGVALSWATALSGAAATAYDVGAHTAGVYLPHQVSGYSFSALSIGGLALGLIWLERNSVLRIGSWGTVLGQVSYPLYLMHWMMMDLTFTVLQRHSIDTARSPRLYAVLALLASFAGGGLLTYAFDRPVQAALRAARRRWQ